jgi:hypothetical protein
MKLKCRILLQYALATLLAVAGPLCATEENECSKEVLLAYFPKIFVDQTLARFKIANDRWEAITTALAAKDQQIIKLVEAKAEKINPNPLKDPQQRQVAVKIFRETLLESFTSVMNDHGITDEKQIQSMLDDIQQQKAKSFAKCMNSMQKKENASPANPQEGSP